MQKRVVRLLGNCPFLVFVATYFGLATSCVKHPPHKITLRVNLFPYLPDAARDNLQGMRSRIKSEFERQNPSVNPEVTLDKNNDFYSIENYKGWLTRFDLVEPIRCRLAVFRDTDLQE
jgi:hypothetical protein